MDEINELGIDTATITKVDPSLYYLEVAMARKVDSSLTDVRGRTEEDGWSLLPFKLQTLQHEFKAPDGSTQSVEIRVRVWARKDSSLPPMHFSGDERQINRLGSNKNYERNHLTRVAEKDCSRA